MIKLSYLKQIGIIFTISFLGEALKLLLPFPIPASIYGLILMLLALILKIIRLDQVRTTSMFLLEIMPILFVPAGVGLLADWGQLSPILFPFAVIVVASTIFVMAITGTVTQCILKKGRKK